jgi:uncharacterized membrane protein
VPGPPASSSTPTLPDTAETNYNQSQCCNVAVANLGSAAAQTLALITQQAAAPQLCQAQQEPASSQSNAVFTVAMTHLGSAAPQARALATSQQQHADLALRYQLQAQLTPLCSLLLVC